jgi:hypothetical protein
MMPKESTNLLPHSPPILRDQQHHATVLTKRDCPVGRIVSAPNLCRRRLPQPCFARVHQVANEAGLLQQATKPKQQQVNGIAFAITHHRTVSNAIALQPLHATASSVSSICHKGPNRHIANHSYSHRHLRNVPSCWMYLLIRSTHPNKETKKSKSHHTVAAFG